MCFHFGVLLQWQFFHFRSEFEELTLGKAFHLLLFLAFIFSKALATELAQDTIGFLAALHESLALPVDPS